MSLSSLTDNIDGYGVEQLLGDSLMAERLRHMVNAFPDVIDMKGYVVPADGANPTQVVIGVPDREGYLPITARLVANKFKVEVQGAY